MAKRRRMGKTAKVWSGFVETPQTGREFKTTKRRIERAGFSEELLRKY